VIVTNVTIVRVRAVGASVVAVIAESVGAGEVREAAARTAEIIRAVRVGEAAEIEVVVAATVVRSVEGKGQERG
jgi:hypothetical protein